MTPFRPCPKVFRAKKAPKPLRRTPLVRKTPLRRSRKPIRRRARLRGLSGRDPASLDEVAIGSIWGPDFACAMTDKNECEFHHILGRGKAFGFGYRHPDRELMSSPFNALPLNQKDHKGPHRDKPVNRWRFLETAEAAVQKAVEAGLYVITDLDRRFIAEIRDPWKAKNPA